MGGGGQQLINAGARKWEMLFPTYLVFWPHPAEWGMGSLKTAYKNARRHDVRATKK